MPSWEGIEDASAMPEAVWFSRVIHSDEKIKNEQQQQQQPSLQQQQEWKPLRKVDCKILNENEIRRKGQHVNDNNNNSQYSSNKQWRIDIDGGRSKADPVIGRIYYNFIRGEEREMISSIWFIQKDDTASSSSASKDSLLTPIPLLRSYDQSDNEPPNNNNDDSDRIELLYQKAIASMSSFGQGITSILKEEVLLSDGISKVMVCKTGSNTFAMKKITKKEGSWVGGSISNILQRGYGQYEVIGEMNEILLGPVKHLIFVVHGIGEALFSRHDIKISNIIDNIDTLRSSIQQKQVDTYHKNLKLPSHQQQSSSLSTSPPHRIEFIPIEWYSRIHDNSTSLMKSLQLTTLTTIPALRTIANDVVLDVLTYMTPAFCESVLECVTRQINDTYEVFKQVHPDFESSGGKVSLAGHSLGSVIVWDLLTILKDFNNQDDMICVSEANDNCIAPMSPLYVDTKIDNDSMDENNIKESSSSDTTRTAPKLISKNVSHHHHGTWGPSLPKVIEHTLSFQPECTILLGSPLGMFLSLRGAHGAFDEMRINNDVEKNNKKNENTILQPGEHQISAAGVDNNGNDVIENETTTKKQPSVSSFFLPTTKFFNIFHPSDPVAYRIEPLLLSPDIDPNDVPPPLYLQAPGKDLRLHVKFKQNIDDIRKSFSINTKSAWGSLLENAVHAVGSELIGKTAATAKDAEKSNTTFPLGGLNDRVDYTLQPNVIDNEYVSAVTAHGSYFTNNDIHDLLISLLEN